MSDADAENADVEGTDDNGEEVEGGKKRRFSGKFLVLFILLPLLLLGGGGAAAYYFLLRPQPEELKTDDAEAKAEEEKQLVFFDMPEMLVDLNSGSSKRKNYIKVNVTLELESAEAIPELEAIMPRIVDSFQIYLRELRVEDLQGSAGLLRLKEELLLRLNTTAQPVKIKDVLFKEMLVQ